jgi:hypothetical protein
MKRKLALYHAEHLSEDEIRIKLSNDYHEIVDSLLKEDKSQKISGESGSQKSGKGVSSKANQGSKKERDGLTAKFGGKKDAKGKGNSTTRRRSFDQNTIVKKVDATSPVVPVALPNEVSHSQLTTLSEVEPDPLLPSKSMNQTSAPTTVEAPSILNEVADSWDSVSQQPFCKICQMAFKSESFLERHIKFSDLHAQNAKKKEKLDEAAKSGAPPPPLIPDRIAPRQVEGEHFKMMYTGSKFFWRTQESVDLHFYHHILPHTIEIISYDTTKSREFNRIYLDYSTLLDIVVDTTKAHANDTMHREMSKRQAAEEKKEENGSESSTHAAGGTGPSLGNGKLVSLRNDEDAQRTAMTTYILQRLQLQSVTTTAAGNAHSFVPPLSPGKAAARELLNSASSPTLPSLTANAQVNGSVMVFAKLTGDDYKRSPVLEKSPIVLVPVVVTRRRRTNAEEIDATISSLTNDRQALAAATGKAEKVANLVYSSASQISSVKWWTKLNPWRRKWVWAIRRVIRQRLVADTKRNLAEREAAMQIK